MAQLFSATSHSTQMTGDAPSQLSAVFQHSIVGALQGLQTTWLDRADASTYKLCK